MLILAKLRRLLRRNFCIQLRKTDSHIFSEKRFVPAEVADKLPSTELIKFDGDEYRVFFNDAMEKCYICHQCHYTLQTCEHSIKQPLQLVPTKPTADISSTLIMELPEDDNVFPNSAKIDLFHQKTIQ